MVKSSSATPAGPRNRPAGPDVVRQGFGKRKHGPALGIVALVAAAALGGCADQAGFGSASARNGQDTSWKVAGPMAPAPQASRMGTQACYGGPSGLVDDCGPFARYNGP